MMSVVSISIPHESAGGSVSAHQIRTMPVVVISPHNQCNCRCVMCDIWKIRDPKEITLTDLERLMASFRVFGVRWVVFTGGEPQMNHQLSSFTRMILPADTRLTILTSS